MSFPFPTLILKMDSYQIIAEVASSEKTRKEGLMYRQSLKNDNGMLFIFETEQAYCFWMKNTQIPLSVAFIQNNGVIRNIADMQPYSLTKHCASEPVKYALEMEQGWFSDRGITAGSIVINQLLFNN